MSIEGTNDSTGSYKFFKSPSELPLVARLRIRPHCKDLLRYAAPFSHGTLQQENVPLSTFGRLLQGEKDELLGFEQSLVRIENPQVVATSGKTHHPIVKFNGRSNGRVSGTAFEITDAELARAEQYEVAPYKG